MMDIQSRFGLEQNPFVKNAKEIIFESNELKEALTRLRYLESIKGFGLLTGRPGNGKTTALRVWARNLNPSRYKVIYISLATLTVMEFYRNLAAELNLVPAFRKIDNFKMIQKEITRCAVETKITPVIILDEANQISNAILSDLKILFNFEMDSRDRAVVLLAGLPQMNYTLNLGIHEPLRQRITMNYNMDGLSKAESIQFIRAKLDGVHCTQHVFDDNALEAIANASNGVPRLLNKLANACLTIADARGFDHVDTETVMQAVNDCQLG